MERTYLSVTVGRMRCGRTLRYVLSYGRKVDVVRLRCIKILGHVSQCLAFVDEICLAVSMFEKIRILHEMRTKIHGFHCLGATFNRVGPGRATSHFTYTPGHIPRHVWCRAVIGRHRLKLQQRLT